MAGIPLRRGAFPQRVRDRTDFGATKRSRERPRRAMTPALSGDKRKARESAARPVKGGESW